MAKHSPEPPQSDDERALLAAVIAHPDEDTPRLIYADWLQENGDPDRAEFIRAHIEWCRRPVNAPQSEGLKQRLTALWDRGADTWRKEFEGVTHVYDRGFVAGIAPPHWEDFWETAEPFVVQAPIQCACFAPSGIADHWHCLFTNLLSARITGLACWMRHGFPAEVVSALSVQPFASSVRVLDMNGCESGPETYRALAAATGLTGLQVLDIGRGCMEDEECDAILNARQLASLVSLRLGETVDISSDACNHITSDGIAAFAKASHLANLRQLDLSQNEYLGDAGIRHLLKWEHIGQLTELNLDSTNIEEGIAILAKSRKLKSLQRLGLGGSMTTEHARALLKSTTLPDLLEVSWWSWIGDDDEELGPKLGERFGSHDLFDFSIVCDEDRIIRRLRAREDVSASAAESLYVTIL